MLYTLQAFCSDIVHFAQVCFVAFSRKCLSLCVILLKLWGWASNLPQCPSYVSHKHAGTLTHDACDCVIHQPLGRNGVATAQTNKLINQAGWGVGGRRTQQWISLSYFTALLISTCIDDDCSHSVRGDYCFHNMQERRHCVVIYAQVCYVYTDAFWVEGWFPCTHPPTHTQVSSWRRVSLQLSEWSKVNSFLLFLYVHFPVIDQKKRSCFLVSDLFWNMWVAWVYVCSARCAWTYCDKGSQQKILVMNCNCLDQGDLHKMLLYTKENLIQSSWWYHIYMSSWYFYIWKAVWDCCLGEHIGSKWTVSSTIGWRFMVSSGWIDLVIPDYFTNPTSRSKFPLIQRNILPSAQQNQENS